MLKALQSHAAMVELGFSEDEIAGVCRLLAAILRLGNTHFIDGHGEAPCKLANAAVGDMRAVAEALGCEAAELEQALLTRTHQVPSPNVDPLAEISPACPRELSLSEWWCLFRVAQRVET